MAKSRLKCWFWGLLTSTLFFSCSSSHNSKSANQNTDNQLNLFKTECIPSSIVNGNQVSQIDPKKYLAVMLIIESHEGEQFLCSASVVDRKLLLTAAHCVNHAAKVMAIFNTNAYCQGGYSKSKQSIEVEKFVFNPEYTDLVDQAKESDRTVKTRNPDVALVLLKNEVPSGYKSQSIVMANPISTDHNLLLMGYGVTSYNAQDDGLILRYQEINQDQLSQANENLLINQSRENSGGLCVGDSGGPVYLKPINEQASFSAQVDGVVAVNSFVYSENNNSIDICKQNGAAVLLAPYVGWLQSEAFKLGQSIQIKN